MVENSRVFRFGKIGEAAAFFYFLSHQRRITISWLLAISLVPNKWDGGCGEKSNAVPSAVGSGVLKFTKQ